MPLLAGDMRFALPASTSQQDIGGGPPTSQLVPDGASNPFLPDLSEDARTGGLVEVVHLHGVLRNTDTDALLGANIIVAEPPDDDAVSCTLIKSPGTFSRRPDLVKLIEASSTPGAEFNGFLLGNLVVGHRGMKIGQRPGQVTPSINTSLVLVQDEGLITERSQYVRIRRVTIATEYFTIESGGQFVDMPIQVADCELYSEIQYDFPGSEANRFYARQTGKTLARRVNVTDAGTFYSASRLTVAAQPTDLDIKLASVYTQIVPNTRTETPLLNQFPGGMRLVDLVDSMGTLQVSAASHTGRVLITEANQGFTQTFKMIPPPAPGSVAMSYMALAQWQTIYDDGAGNMGDGPGGGQVLYPTGDASVTTDALSDYNTFQIWTWADTAPFTNAVPSGPVAITTRPPEFALDLTPGSVVDGATIAWESDGVAKLATANAAGVLSGDASGIMVSALGKAFIRPAAMPDAGSNFTITYASKPTITQSFSGVGVDGGGYGAIALSDEPLPSTVSVRWITARKVSKSSGADLSGTSTTKSSEDGVIGSAGWSHSSGGVIGRAYSRTSVGNSQYSQTKESSTTDTLVVAHSITDDGAGGFGDVLLGSINYAGKAISLRMVSQGASVSSYRQDHENAASFAASSPSVSMG